MSVVALTDRMQPRCLIGVDRIRQVKAGQKRKKKGGGGGRQNVLKDCYSSTFLYVKMQ